MEAHLEADAPAVGRELRDLTLPEGSTIAVLVRDGRAIFTRPETRLLAGDKLLAVTSADARSGAARAAHRGMSASVDPGRVLRRAIVGWGLGHAALGQREVGAALLAAELLGLALIGAASATLADTTWYLVPFVMGSAFLVA